ncbi:STAS domain-containing protein [Streptomyces sp. NPDC056069]|uniref:STAS domain-containing protein n=1 Tax=Streptomyces sp. NPDC056069 TaxID=3345702 RepID=UPI0035DA02C9
MLHLNGELDLATAPLVDLAVTFALAGQPRAFWLDLTGIVFCDMTGLRVLQRLTERVRAARAPLHLTDLHPNLRHTLTRLETVSPWTPPALQK